MANKSPYPAWYSLFFIVHPPTEERPYWGLELDISRLTGFLAVVFGGWVVYKIGDASDWTLTLPVIIAILTYLSGLVALVYLGSLPVDKMRIAGQSKVPSDLARSMNPNAPAAPAEPEKEPSE